MGVKDNEMYRIEGLKTVRVFSSENGEYIGGGVPPYYLVNTYIKDPSEADDKGTSKKEYEKAVQKYAESEYIWLGRTYGIKKEQCDEYGHEYIGDILDKAEKGDISVFEASESPYVDKRSDLFFFDEE